MFTGAKLIQLQQDAKATLHSAYALGTFENLNTQWVKYLRFCIYFGLCGFPATTLILVWYPQFLSRSLKSRNSIVAYLSGVKTLHTVLKFNTSGFNGILLKMTLKGLRRNNKHIVRRARPMTPAILRELHASLDHSDPVQAIFWGICIFAFLLLFRKSNLIPNRINCFDPDKQITHGDCVLQKDLSSITVGIRWSKNQQFSRELLTFTLPALPGSVLCPVQALINIRSLVPAQASQHVFQLPGNDGSFTYRRFHTMLKDQLKKINVKDFNQYTSHSFRRGGTTFSFLCGIPVEMIKLLGNWKSDAYLSYIEFPLETRTAACELIKMRLLAMEHFNTRN